MMIFQFHLSKAAVSWPPTRVQQSSVLCQTSGVLLLPVIARFVRLALMLTFSIGMMGATGCMSMQLWKPRPEISKADPPISRTATSEEILARINENSYCEFSPEGLRSYRCDDARVRMKGVPSSMQASLVVEAPRNLRLRVANPLSGGEAVDIGSNEQDFWFWTKDSQPQNVVVCSHDQVAAACQVTTLPIPFRPDWLMEVLGVVPISGNDYEVHREREKSPIVELVSTQRTPDQKSVRRIVKVNMQYGVVLEHRVETLEGKLVAKAILSRHFRDPATKLILPREISIDWPAAGQQMKMSLEFQNVEFNSPKESNEMWNIPQMAGYPPFDLGEYAMKQLGKTASSSIAKEGRGRDSQGAGQVVLEDGVPHSEGRQSPFPERTGINEREQYAAGESDQSWSSDAEPAALDTIERSVRQAGDSSRSEVPYDDDTEQESPSHASPLSNPQDDAMSDGTEYGTIGNDPSIPDSSSSNPRPFPRN